MDPLAAMKRVPIPPEEGAKTVASPVNGGARRPGAFAARSPLLYLVNLRWTLGHPQRRDKALWQR
jgi:hypothetical protein